MTPRSSTSTRLIFSREVTDVCVAYCARPVDRVCLCAFGGRGCGLSRGLLCVAPLHGRLCPLKGSDGLLQFGMCKVSLLHPGCRCALIELDVGDVHVVVA